MPRPTTKMLRSTLLLSFVTASCLTEDSEESPEFDRQQPDDRRLYATPADAQLPSNPEPDVSDPLGIRCGALVTAEMAGSWTDADGDGVPAGFQVELVEGTSKVRLELRLFDGTEVVVAEEEYDAEGATTLENPVEPAIDADFLARIRDSGVSFGFVAGDLFAEDASNRVLAAVALPQVMVHVEADGTVSVATPADASLAYAGGSEAHPELQGEYDAVLAGVTDDEENVHIALITRSSGYAVGSEK